MKQKGFSVSLSHACDGIERTTNIIRRVRPSIIAYSIMTGEHLAALEFNRNLKTHHKFISVFGGPHATFSPDLIDDPDCDSVCVGEGDLAFPDFSLRVKCDDDYWNTPNFIVRYQGTIYKNDPRPLVEDLDALPIPDNDLIFEDDKLLRNDTSKSFFTSRGCPYKCTYCFNNKYNAIYKNKGCIIRYKSPERVIAEIAATKKRYPLDFVGFADDSFLSKPSDWIDNFCRLYKQEIGLPFSCNVRANLIKKETLAKLHEAGLYVVWMGVECGDEKIANEILLRNISNKQIINATETIKSIGIKLITQNLTGLPINNSFETDLRTIDLNIQIQPDFAWSSILYPYSGTPIADYAKEHGFLTLEMESTGTNKRISTLKFPSADKKKIENLHKLFGLIVNFPILRRYAPILSKMPFSKLYLMIFYAWYGYCLKIKTRPNANAFKETMRNIGLFFRMVNLK
ncbi:MAG: B12-binding domain-containing radical SAM protein [Desulfovibrio sp.]|nr:B12-binding domain-containing radical SAM protein [Desulfovibrio sp.]MBI4961457.1 B12-binding domain-containing radical SAM protein [Desulfovibrio sp.]